MIPRFIVRDSDETLLKLLEEIGYTCMEDPIPKDILIIGSSILKAPPAKKNPLIVNIRLDNRIANAADIVNQAILHSKWQREVQQVKHATVKVGSDKYSVTITRVGVMVDSFVVPMESFVRLAKYCTTGVLDAPLPKIATHLPVPKNGGMTIGCADYTMRDFNVMLDVYNKLTTKQ